MSNLKISLHQFNPIIGDVDNNVNVIKEAVITARAAKCDLFITSELAITGYPPKDLLLRESFYHATQKAFQQLLEINDITIVCGIQRVEGKIRTADGCSHSFLENNTDSKNVVLAKNTFGAYTSNQFDKLIKVFNSAVVIRDGSIVGYYDKAILPNYDVFDECRYFDSGSEPLVFDCNGVRVGIIICEDMWQENPIKMSVKHGAEIICILNASPYDIEKQKNRIEVASKRVAENQVPLIYVNQIGGQDDLVFDGASFAMDNTGTLALQLPAFISEIGYIHYTDLATMDSCLRWNDKKTCENENSTYQPRLDLGSISYPPKMLGFCDMKYGTVAYPAKIEGIYQALVLALKDYVNKNGFNGIVLGLSGGIDSALTLAIAYDALGRDRVMAVLMPSMYTAEISNLDAKEMIDKLQIKSAVLPIENIVSSFKNELEIHLTEFGNNSSSVAPNDTTFENLQARTRGVILMAISNRLGYLVVSTGNKSEMAVGYATLYGDMAGGFALLKDVNKTTVYALSRYRNAQSDIIPERIITRAPSAELRENQTDQDSLPEYDMLDQIIEMLVEKNLSTTEVVLLGFPDAIVTQVSNLLKSSEHKRSQAAVGPKITSRAFGSDWRMPITSKFKF